MKKLQMTQMEVVQAGGCLREMMRLAPEQGLWLNAKLCFFS